MSGRGDERIEIAVERVLARGPADVLDLLQGLRRAAGEVLAGQEGALHAFLHARLRTGRLIVAGRSPRGLARYTRPGDAAEAPEAPPPVPEPLPASVSKAAVRIARGVRDDADRGRILADVVAHLEALRAAGHEEAFGVPRVVRGLVQRADRGRLAVYFKATTADGVRRLAFHEGPWIAGAVVLFFLLRAFVGEVFQIPSESMRPTLQPGDRVVVPKLNQGEVPERWRIVVFRHHSAVRGREIAVVKRLVGLPGEQIAIFQGDVFLDGTLAVKPDFAREALRLPKARWQMEEGTLLDWDKGISHDEVTWRLRRYPLSGEIDYDGEAPTGPRAVALYDAYLGLEAARAVDGAASVTLSRGRLGEDAGAVEWTLVVEAGRARLAERTAAGARVLATAERGPPAAGPVALELAYVDGVVRASFEAGDARWATAHPRPAPYRPLALRVGTRGPAAIRRIRLDQDVHYSHQHSHGIPTPADLAAGRRNPHRIPRGHVFFLGDNTRDSTDSRSRLTGDIPVTAIVGPVRLRIWPPGRIGVPR